MRLLITGGYGFIGSHFVEAAERAGHQVSIIDSLTYAGRSNNLVEHGSQRIDICDAAAVRERFAAFRPDAVVHLAAESHVARSIDCREEFLRTNVGGTLTLLDAALDYWREEDLDGAFRFLHVSTDEVYGSLGPKEAPWTEISPYAPNNPYAASKAASDHLVRSYVRTFGLPAIITHSSNNYGSRQHPEKLIPTLVRQVMASEVMTLHGDGSNVRDWLHVDDHCEGLLAALIYGTPGHTYNLGGRCERSNLQIARLISGAMLGPDATPPIVFVSDRPGNDARYSTAVHRAGFRLRWRPGVEIEQRLADTIQWYLDNPTYHLDYGH